MRQLGFGYKRAIVKHRNCWVAVKHHVAATVLEQYTSPARSVASASLISDPMHPQ